MMSSYNCATSTSVSLLLAFSRLVTSAFAVSMAVIQLTPVSMAIRRIRKPSLLLSRPWVGINDQIDFVS